MLRAMDEFSSHTTGKSYKMKFRVYCKSSNIVYFITCRRCGLQYVRETSQPLYARINGHWSDIVHRRTDVSPVAESTAVHTQIAAMVIELHVSTSHYPCLWKGMEGRWIRTLETLFPSGMILRVDSLWNLVCILLFMGKKNLAEFFSNIVVQ